MPLNKELLLKVKAHILEEPKRLDMGTWISTFDEVAIANNPHIPACGTIGCIAGWAVILSLPGKTAEDIETEIAIESAAQDLLGITTQERVSLFYANNWPAGFADNYTYAGSNQERAQALADRIDYFIDCYEKNQKGA